MSVPVALLVVFALLALTIVVGVLLRRRDGRRRAARSADERVIAADLAPAALGARATLVQFSTEFCARCPQVRRLLGEIAADRDGVALADVDLTHRADLAARYRVRSTPTTLIIDAEGRVRSRFVGVPDRPALLAALDEATELQEVSR